MLKYFFYSAITYLLLFSQFVFAASTINPASTQLKLNRLKINLGEQIVNQIKNDPSYVEMFKSAYGANVTAENIVDALTEYEHSLATSSRFDDYLRGNKNMLTPEEIRGYELFKSYGCSVCHSGENLGGTQFQQLGRARNYIIERKTLLTPADLGLAEVTKKSKDLYVFKVPPMRNVAIIYPYYHDGSVKSLNEAVYLMGKYQIGVEIPDQDVKAIVAFLKSFTSKSFDQQNSNSSAKKD